VCGRGGLVVGGRVAAQVDGLEVGEGGAEAVESVGHSATPSASAILGNNHQASEVRFAPVTPRLQL